MLNPRPEQGTKVWGNEVVERDGDFVFVPREVVFQYMDRGLVWFTAVGQYGGAMGWYASAFFYTDKESQDECDLLNREAKGEEVRCSLVERDIYNYLKSSETRGPVRIV